jgi:cell wall-associated NlpC family hydrolase
LTKSAGQTHFDGSGPLAVIANHAKQFGLDPAAVMAYALEESSAKYGAVGDKGTSFGPFQAHIGGAAGSRTPQQASAWANSPQGLIQMMGMMSRSGARGLTGANAVRAIYSGFGKGTPLAVPRGLARYGEAQQMLSHLNQAGPMVTVDHNQKIAPKAAPIIKLAGQYLGTPYHWGGAAPSTGFDCSGFVQWLYGQKGISLPRTTYQQWHAGTPVKGALKPGDIVFFEPSSQGPGHEGLYIGKGQFIQSPHTGDVIKISALSDYRNIYVGARRIL